MESRGMGMIDEKGNLDDVALDDVAELKSCRLP